MASSAFLYRAAEKIASDGGANGSDKRRSFALLSKKVLARNLRLQDKAIIEENYRFNSGKNLESFPTLPLDGLRYAIDSLASTVPSVKNLKPEGAG
jgi:hypothetical protein